MRCILQLLLHVGSIPLVFFLFCYVVVISSFCFFCSSFSVFFFLIS